MSKSKTLTKLLLTFIVLFLSILFVLKQETKVTQEVSADPNQYGELQVTLKRITDGSPTFDSTTWAPVVAGDNSSAGTNPGTDANANNGIVRNSDFVTYRVEMNVNKANNGNDEKPNPNGISFTFVVDPHQVILALPAACLTDATLIPVSSYTATAITCNLGYKQFGTTGVVDIPAKVLGSTLNNSTLTADVTATTGADLKGGLPAQIITVSTAAPKVDVIKQLFKSEDVKGPANEDGKLLTYSVTMVAAKGSEALQSGNITLTDQFTLLPASPNNPNSNTARLYTWGTTPACNYNGQGLTITDQPFGNPSLGSTPTVDSNGNPILVDPDTNNSTVNSGSWNCTETTTVGSNTYPNYHEFSIVITGADVSLATSGPSLKANGLTTGAGTYMVSGYIQVWVPLVDYQMLTTGTKSVTAHNEILAFTGKSVSNINNTEPDLTNNYANKFLLSEYSTSSAGCGWRGGAADVNNYPRGGGQFITPNTLLNVNGGALLSGSCPIQTDSINCIKFDKTKLEFQGFDIYNRIIDGTSNPIEQIKAIRGLHSLYPNQYSSPNPLYTVNGYAWDTKNPAPNYPYVIEYFTGTVPNLRTSQCDNTIGAWSSTPPSDLSTVSAVRIRSTFPALSATYRDLNIWPQLKVLQNPASTPIKINQSYYYPTTGWIHSNGTADGGPYTAGANTFYIAPARVSTSKVTCADNNLSNLPTTSELTSATCDDSVNVGNPGDHFTYEIKNNLELPTTPTQPYSTTTVKVVDVLPNTTLYDGNAVLIDPDTSDGFDPTTSCTLTTAQIHQHQDKQHSQ